MLSEKTQAIESLLAERGYLVSHISAAVNDDGAVTHHIQAVEPADEQSKSLALQMTQAKRDLSAAQARFLTQLASDAYAQSAAQAQPDAAEST